MRLVTDRRMIQSTLVDRVDRDGRVFDVQSECRSTAIPGNSQKDQWNQPRIGHGHHRFSTSWYQSTYEDPERDSSRPAQIFHVSSTNVTHSIRVSLCSFVVPGPESSLQSADTGAGEQNRDLIPVFVDLLQHEVMLIGYEGIRPGESDNGNALAKDRLLRQTPPLRLNFGR